MIDFNVDGEKKSLNIKESKKNVICFGGTGSGKTTNFILPAINNLIKNNCCGLILDVKADLFKGVYDIAIKNNRREDIAIIGLDDVCEEINLFASLRNHEQLKNVLMATIGDQNKNNDSYFLNSGIQDFINISKLYQWVEENIYKNDFVFNAKTCFELINDRSVIYSLYKKLEEYEDYFDEDIDFVYKATLQDPFSIYNSIVNEEPDQDAPSQKEWRSGQITKILQNFIEEPVYSKMFNKNSTKSIYDLIFKEGKILVLVIPIEFESIGYLLGRLVREIYFKSVLINGKKERNELKIGESFNRYSFLVIDEYQGYINTEGKNGVITDEYWASISRSFENINIFATQSMSSLFSAAGNIEDVDTLMQNCINEVILTTKDRRTTEHIEYIYKDLFDNNILKIADFINPKERFGLFRISDENGGINIYKGDFKLGEESIYHNSGYQDQIENEYEELKKNLKSKIKQKTEDIYIKINLGNKLLLDNNKKIMKEKLENRRLYRELKETLLSYGSENLVVDKFMLTPFNISLNNEENNDSLCQNIKYLNFLKKEYNEKELLSELLVREYGRDSKIAFIAKKSYETYSDVTEFFEIKDNELFDNYKNVRGQNFIFIFMGGGDLNSLQFKRYKNGNMMKYLRENNPNAVILTALGHAKNRFLTDLVSDKDFNTPANMGEYLKKLSRNLNKIKK